MRHLPYAATWGSTRWAGPKDVAKAMVDKIMRDPEKSDYEALRLWIELA